MNNVLLKELRSQDIDWINASGRHQTIAAGTVIVQEGKSSDSLYIVLDGTLAVLIPEARDNPLGRAFAAIEEGDTAREVFRLSSGEVVGEIPLVGTRSTVTTIKALEESLVLSIPQQSLLSKLQQDVGFAARFYRTIAVLLSERVQHLIDRMHRSKLLPGKSVRDVLFILATLNDSDLDWMLLNGQQQTVPAHTVLIRQGGPVDALYLLLDGAMGVSIAEQERNPLTRAFAAIEGSELPTREIARLSQGEIFGETPFLDAHLPFATITALTQSRVLAIPRQQLATKLQQDVGFAARFYQVLAQLLAHRRQSLLARLGYGRRVYRKGSSLNSGAEYEDELDANTLDQLAIAGTRFDWFLRQLSNH